MSPTDFTGRTFAESAAAGLAAPAARAAELRMTASAVAIDMLRLRTVMCTPTQEARCPPGGSEMNGPRVPPHTDDGAWTLPKTQRMACQ
ncbi:hypothetical protein GCM10027073_68430 [Streptomyces chlorus]